MMAARRYVHSARALPRTLKLTANKVASIFGVPHRLIRRRACRLLAVPVVPLRTQGDNAARSMTTNMFITKRDLGTSELAKQPRLHYEEAVVALNSLQSNAESIRKSLLFRNEARKHNIPNMIEYLQRVGLTLDDVDKLSVIHVTGTKGKGSTCAFAESILRQYGYRTGIFSSPHLIEVRERIRINGRPIDRDLFSSSFWHVFEKLQATKEGSEGGMPPYFNFLTVMALYVFVREGVDVGVLEVGIGGQYDTTNVVRSPVVCGVSSLDLDHTNLLGNTLEEIAWHKAGIFKPGAQAVTVPQPDSAMDVILSRSQEHQCPLSIAAPMTLEELSPSCDLHLGIAGQKQLYNAALAVQLCRFWLAAQEMEKEAEHSGETPSAAEKGTAAGVTPTSVENIPVLQTTGLPEKMIRGLCECQWPGRTQTIPRPGVTYYLDGAHTTDSVQQCVEWFQDSADKERKKFKGKVWRAMVFNMTGDRSVSCLLKKLQECEFDMAAFCPNVVSTIASKNIPDQFNRTVEQDTMLEKCRSNRQTWDQLFVQPAPPLNHTESVIQMTSNQSSAGTNGSASHFPSAAVVEDDDDRRRRTAMNSHNQSRLGGEGVGGCSVSSAQQQQQCVSDSFPCITSALQWATKGSNGGQGSDLGGPPPAAGAGQDVNENEALVQVLVTGSLHLVGGVLELLTPDMNN